MSGLINRIITLFTSLVILTAMVGCGGSGSDATTSTTTSGETGIVGILLTDKPADPDLFSAINVTIVKAELLGADDNRVELFSGLKTYDLLQLRNESAPFTFSDNVPVGTYCKVRLTLAVNGLELVLADDTPDDATDDETYYPKLTGNRKLDLLARDCFDVVAGGTVTLQLDMAAGDSIHIVQKGNKTEYNFRPVVFIDVLEQGFTGRLVRLEGEIAAVDPSNNSLLLCKVLTTAQSYDRSCVRVLLGDNSAFFDNIEYFGDPRPMSELLDKDNVGAPATVVGLFKPMATPYDDIDIPDDELPDLGDCRIWHPDWETNQQPLPGDCDDLAQTLPADAVLIDDAGDPVQDHRPLMLLDGLAVELGEFLSLDGEVATAANEESFVMQVNPAQPVAAGPLAVALQAGGEVGIEPYNGTRILSKQGKLLDFTSITQFRAVTVDGVLQTSNTSDDVLKSAVVIVDTDLLGTEQATGVITQFLAVDVFELQPGAEQAPCGLTDSLRVTLDDSVVITSVSITDDGYDVAPGGVPAVGDEVGVTGVCEDGGLTAEALIIVDDQRSTTL